MSPARLIELVETQWETIAQQAIARLHADPLVPNYHALTDEQLRARARDLLAHLGRWLARREEESLARRYEDLGRRRYAEGMPLHEVIYKLQVLKRVVHQHARDQHLEVTAIELYAEQEFLHLIDEFFDNIVFRISKGYCEEQMSTRPASTRAESPRRAAA